LISRLENIQPRDLNSLLLEVFRRKNQKQSPDQILKSYREKYLYLGVSELDQRDLIKFDSFFYDVVPRHFRAVELSPVGPIGINGTLGKISQNNVLSALRNMEMVGDPTTMLSLEAAVERRKLLDADGMNNERIALCTSKRLLRLQPFDRKKGYMQHFKCFGMLTAGRDNDYERFSAETMTEHIATYLNFVAALNQREFDLKDVTIHLSDIRIIEQLIVSEGLDREVTTKNAQNPDFDPFVACGINLPCFVGNVHDIDSAQIDQYRIAPNIHLLAQFDRRGIASLQEKFPWAHFDFHLSRTAGIGYYTDLCFHIFGTNRNGLLLQLADGGLTDWTQKLLHSKKELCMASGFGADLIHKMFRRA
jgi:hypothetical protein